MQVIEQCEGIFSISVFKTDNNGNEVPGSRREPVPPFRNLITNAGLDRMGGFGDFLTWCQVGSGSGAPAPGDTTLQSRVAGTNIRNSTVTGSQGSAPYFTWLRNVMRFAQGVATGVLAEVGIGWASTGSLFSRALILDALGTPTTITVLADESLDVTYELRSYPSVTDVTGTIVATGNIGGSYNYILRAANVTNNDSQSGWLIEATGVSAGQLSPTGDGKNVYDGSIGPITGRPAGAVQRGKSITVSAYSAGSYKRDFSLVLGLNDANFPTGLRSAMIKIGTGCYQIQVDPVIAKTPNDEVVFNLSHSWARRQ